MQNLKITIIQCPLVWEDRDANLDAFSHRLNAIDTQPDLIVLPEMFSTGFSMNGNKCAEEPGGKAFQWLKQKSAEMNAVIACSIMVCENGKFFNRFFWVRPDGTFNSYDKRHLFRFANEHKYFEAGKDMLTTELNGWKFRPMVCYDLRFPVWNRNKYENGVFEYDCLLYVANWPATRSRFWTSLMTARAMENLSFCIGVNRVGKDGNGNEYSGDSKVLDPAGMVTGECEPYKEKIVSVTLSADILLKWRRDFNTGPDWDKFSLL